MAEVLTPEQQEMLAKAKGVSSTTIAQEDPRIAGIDTPPDVTETGQYPEWGPYKDYTQVPLQHGVYGLEAGKILFFIPVDVYSRRENRMVRSHQRLFRTPEQTQREVIEAYKNRIGPDIRLPDEE